MSNINELYKNLTNIDIDEQKKIWDERGKGYYGEYLLFSNLYDFISGDCKILMNLEIPAPNSKTTEIDTILIHETGIYVFEVKHYKGRIYGKDTDKNWTQYFRTAPNSSFKNPVSQNKYHIEALKKLYPTTPIHSIIVFTSYDCELCVENLDPDIEICELHKLKNKLSSKLNSAEKIYNLTEIDNIFNELSKYSPMIKEPVLTDTEPMPFVSWLKPYIDNLKSEKENLINAQNAHNDSKKKFIRYRNIAISLALVFAIICGIFAYFISNKIISYKESQIEAFKQNFLHIDEIDNPYIDSLKTYVSVTNQELKPLTDDAVSFKARINSKTDTYGIVLQENTKYIVMKTDGKVLEYDMFGESLRYSWISNIVGTGYRSYGDLNQIEFYGISNVQEIDYIKITNIQLIKLDMQRTVIKDNLELELYSK